MKAAFAIGLVALPIALAGCAATVTRTPDRAAIPAGPAAPPSDTLVPERPLPLKEFTTAREESLLHAGIPGVRAPALGPPRVSRDGRADWSGVTSALTPRAAWIRDRAESLATGADSIRFWASLGRGGAADTPFVAFVLHRLAPLYLAGGDTARADSCLAGLAALPSVWQWEALRSRAELLTAGGGTARADSVLAVADRRGWPELERVAWLARRARLRAALGDTAQAAEFCRQAIRRYPSLPPARQMLSMLESLSRARGETLSSEDEAAAAEVEIFRPDREAAERRLERAFARRTSAGRWRAGFRLAEVQRMLRRFPAGLRTLAAAMALAPADAERAACLLERARLHRDAGRADSSYAWFEAAARAAPDSGMRETAWWEGAQEAEEAGEGPRARGYYLRVAELGRRRSADAALRLGLLWFAEGARDSALAAWRPPGTEAARFWSAVALRAERRAEADSALAALAALPGYGFYRAAARDTLGVRGWPGVAFPEGCQVPGTPGSATLTGARDTACAGLLLARDLLSLGARDEALLLLSRWTAGDPRVAGGARGGERQDPLVLLSASRVAYEAGRLPAGIRQALLAAEAAATSPAGEQWGAVPWAYPPAFDSLYATLPETAAPDSMDRALMQALTWQESKFDPDARSRSNALGLMQLKLPAANDVAAWLHEPAPGEAGLRDPGRNFRYGTAYLRRLLRRFGLVRSAGLAAYNAGPGRIPPRWREFVDRGGEALLTELVPYPETRDYVKKILGTRAAYRELRPTSLPGR